MATEQQTRESPDRPDNPERPDRTGKRSARIVRREERMALVNKAKEVRRVRVTPATEGFRRTMKHPRLGGFRSAGSIEWPLDNWTKRRIREGSLTVENRPPNQPNQPAQEQRRPARDLGTGRPSGGATSA